MLKTIVFQFHDQYYLVEATSEFFAFVCFQTEIFNSDSQDPVSIGPVNPLLSELDNVTLCDEFCPCSPNLTESTKLSPNEQDLARQNVLLTSFQFTQFGDSSDLDKSANHLQKHSLVTDFFVRDILKHSQKTWDSESRKQDDEGHHSAFSDSSQYIHFNQYNCQCKDCCDVKRLSDHQLNIDPDREV